MIKILELYLIEDLILFSFDTGSVQYNDLPGQNSTYKITNKTVKEQQKKAINRKTTLKTKKLLGRTQLGIQIVWTKQIIQND